MKNMSDVYETAEYRAELRRLHRFQLRLFLLCAVIAAIVFAVKWLAG